MYSICLIDDRCYGIPQVINALPDNLEYEFFYYDRVPSIEPRKYDIVLLDYYLDKDNLTGEDIYDTLQAECIIAFSSEISKNEKLIKKGAQYQVKKLQDKTNNPALRAIMQKIFKN